MLISLHLPKTAGTSFRQMLADLYGDRLLLDYGDLIGDESDSSKAIRERRKSETITKLDSIKENYDVIHGHFYASKYANLFPQASYITTLRHPLTRIPSHYDYLKRNAGPGNLLSKHPLASAILDQNMTLDDFIRWDYMTNLFSRLLEPLQISDFLFVGIQEHYSLSNKLLVRKLGLQRQKSVKKHTLFAQLARKIGLHTSKSSGTNTNPNKDGYNLTIDQANAIARIHDADIDMYEKALAAFHTEIKSIS